MSCSQQYRNELRRQASGLGLTGKENKESGTAPCQAAYSQMRFLSMRFLSKPAILVLGRGANEIRGY
jgi:hypothetical protein